MKLTLYWKVIILCLGILLYTGFSLFYITTSKHEDALESQIRNELQNKSVYIMSNIDRFIYERLSDIKDISQEHILMDSLECIMYCEKRLEELQTTNPFYESISVFNNDRIRLYDSKKFCIGEKHTKTKYWLKLKDTSVVMDISYSESLQQIVMHFASVIYDHHHNPKGVVVTRVLIKDLYQVFSNVVNTNSFDEGLHIDLVDSKGMILYSNHEPGKVLKQEHPYFLMYSNLLKTENQPHYYSHSDNNIYLFSKELGYLSYKGSHWTLVMNVPTTTAFSLLYDLQKTVLKYSIPVMILSIVLAILFARYLVRPIIILSDLARAYGDGNFDVDFSLKTDDERQILADNMKWMAHQLKEKIINQDQLHQELEQKYDLLSFQKHKIEIQQNQIGSSLRYAKRLQQAMLPNMKNIQNPFFDFFVFFRPLEIVSGDFYYFEKVDDKFVIAVIDCTGHGVPGAFMTIIANNLLHQIVGVEKEINPSKILTLLNKRMQNMLKMQGGEELKDGMDIGLCAIDPAQQVINFSGAYHSCILIRNHQVQVFRGDRFSIGDNIHHKSTLHQTSLFKEHQIFYEQEDGLYLFTDGITDQFGGEKDKKFTRKKLQEKLLSYQGKSSLEQKQLLEWDLQEWQGQTDQTDDMLLIGIDFLKIGSFNSSLKYDNQEEVC